MSSEAEAIDAIGRLQRLREFAGSPREFWPAYGLALLAAADGERIVVLTRRTAADGGSWQTLAQAGGDWPTTQAELFALADRVVAEGGAWGVGGNGSLAGVVLASGEPGRGCVAVFAGAAVARKRDLLRLAADVPASYRQATLLRRSQADLAGFSSTLDLLAVLRGRETFLEAAFTLCNELAARHACHQVALGWLHGRWVEVEALSHREKFDRRMDAVQAIAAAMEEALDQDDEVGWPALGSAHVTRDHARCAATLGTAHLLTVPLRMGRRVIGALWLARGAPAFGDAELNTLRVEADQVAEPLWHLRRRDRWWGARWTAEIEEALRRRWNLEHPGLKLGGVLATAIVLFALTVPLSYRVEAPFVLRPAAQALLGAAYDGYLDRVDVVAGDRVTAGQILFALNDASWKLQEAALAADASRFQAEAEQAQGQGRRAEMRIALAQAEQTQAQLAQVRLNLDGAVVRAPFAGMVVEDADLRERIGAAVTRGDVLLRVAQAGGLFAELDVPEPAVDDVAEGAGGELAFATRPDESWAIRISRIEPAAVAKADGGVFPTRAEFVGAPPEWIRPGMTGVAKINAGRRTAFWQLTHRLVDWLRLQLWW